MELQLALTLSSSSVISRKYESKEMVASNHLLNNQDCSMINRKKRSYEKAFEEVNSTDVPQTLSLFVWKTNGEDDRDESVEKRPIHFQKNEEDESSIVGWPPVKSWRKRLCLLGSTTNYVTVDNAANGSQDVGRGSNHDSTYVKVKMEGVGIARKVDLSLHHSFETLTDTLINMFGKCHENVQAYKLAYQDKDGDWLFAGDVPWGTFVRSVQRIKLLKNGDSMLAI